MQQAFAFMNQGGMVDDGATVEPSTGNEVPPGSLEEEVADSVDAKLSVGEYVVPADVVQFYGVNHFEKLRDKAKEGLAKMETNGRIGGDPAEEELPFSDEELITEDGGPNGGAGFAAGGVVSPTSGVQTVMYESADGQQIPILFINGQPIQQIPQGFAPQDAVKEQRKTSDTAFKDIKAMGAVGDNPEGDNQAPERVPPKEWTTEDFENFVNNQQIVGGISKGLSVVGPAGLAMGAMVAQGNKFTANAALKELNARLGVEGLDEQSRARLEGLKGQLEEAAGGDVVNQGLIGTLFGGNIQGGLLGKASSWMQDQLSPSKAAAPASGTGIQLGGSSRAGSGGGVGVSTTRSDDKSGGGSRVSTGGQAKPSQGVSPSINKTQASPKGSRNVGNVKTSGQQVANTGGFNNEEGKWGSGPFAEGGLVKRRYKK